MLSGSIPALVTPMQDNGEIDLVSLQNLVKWQESTGTSAIVILGSTGEATSLSADERDSVLKAVLAVRKSAQIWVGATAPNTRKSQQYVLRAKALGADGVMVAPPPYVKPTEAGMIKHYEALADLGLPMLLYNVPSRCGVDLKPHIVLQLAEHPGIVGIKEAGDINRLKDYQLKSFVGLCGEDNDWPHALSLGSKGIISVTANVAPSAMHLYYQTRDPKLWSKLSALHEVMFCQTNPIPVKWALHQMDKIPSGIRLPLLPLENQYHATVLHGLKEVVDASDFMSVHSIA